MDISIIIPTYNAGSSLLRMVSCILNQGIDFGEGNGLIYKGEIIIINDGSTDDSVKKVEEYLNSKNYSNIQIINQKNRGVSYSRNYGLSLAKGKYIYFADADDYLLPYTLNQILKLLNIEPAEIARFNYGYVMRGSSEDSFDTKSLPPCKKLYVHSKIEAEKYLEQNKGIHKTTLWHLLIKRELIGDIVFNTNLILEEDYLFLLTLFVKNPEIILIEGDKPYKYVRYPESTCWRLTPEKAFNYKYSSLAYASLIESINFPSKTNAILASVKNRYNICVMIYITSLIKYQENLPSWHHSIKLYREFKKKIDKSKRDLQNCPLSNSYKDKLKYIIVNHSIIFVFLSLSKKILKCCNFSFSHS